MTMKTTQYSSTAVQIPATKSKSWKLKENFTDKKGELSLFHPIDQSCILSFACKWTQEDAESNFILWSTTFIQTLTKLCTTGVTSGSNWMKMRIINLDLMKENTKSISKTSYTPPLGFKQQTTIGGAFQILWFTRTIMKLGFKSSTDLIKKLCKIKSWE